jgi:hypothetical protein
MHLLIRRLGWAGPVGNPPTASTPALLETAADRWAGDDRRLDRQRQRAYARGPVLLALLYALLPPASRPHRHPRSIERARQPRPDAVGRRRGGVFCRHACPPAFWCPEHAGRVQGAETRSVSSPHLLRVRTMVTAKCATPCRREEEEDIEPLEEHGVHRGVVACQDRPAMGTPELPPAERRTPRTCRLPSEAGPVRHERVPLG